MGSWNGRWGRASVVRLCLLAVVASASVVGVTATGDAVGVATPEVVGSPTATGTTTSGQTPYGGEPHPIPGTIRADAFDRGGEGVAYHDADPENVGDVYRSTGVDVDQELDGSYYVGWIEAGEWLEYTVTVPETGEYAVTARASTHDESGARFRVDVDGQRVGSTAFGDTGGWRNWVDRRIGTTRLSDGTHVVRVYSQRDGWNFDALVFERVDATATDAGTTATASTEPPATMTRTESTASGSETTRVVQRTAASSTTVPASTATGSAVPTDTTEGSGPGFGPVAALTGALAAALFERWR